MNEEAEFLVSNYGFPLSFLCSVSWTFSFLCFIISLSSFSNYKSQQFTVAFGHLNLSY